MSKDPMKRGTILNADECEALKAKCHEENTAESLRWGSFGENNDEAKKVRFVADLDTAHIENILMCGAPPPLYAAALLEELRKRGDFRRPVKLNHQYDLSKKTENLSVNGNPAFFFTATEGMEGADILEVAEAVLDHLEIPYESNQEQASL